MDLFLISKGYISIRILLNRDKINELFAINQITKVNKNGWPAGENLIGFDGGMVRKYKSEIWAYCLMPSHIHLIAVSETKDRLNLAVAQAIGENDQFQKRLSKDDILVKRSPPS